MPDVFDQLTQDSGQDIFDLVGTDSPTPETDSMLSRLNKLAQTPSPEFLRKPEEAVKGYVKGMIPGDIKGALRAMNLPTDFSSPEQLTEFALPMLAPAIQTLEGIKGRAQQIQEAEKTPAGSLERWNAGIGTILDLAQLATLFKGGEAIGERTARPSEAPTTVTPPEAQTRPIEPIQAQEQPFTAPLETQPTAGGEQYAQQPSYAQVQEGDVALGEQARPEGEVPQPSDSDNVVREAGGEEPIVAGRPPETDVVTLYHSSPKKFEAFAGTGTETGLGGKAFYFSDKPEPAYGENVVKVQVPRDKILDLSQADPSIKTDAQIRKAGYEGTFNPSTGEYTVYDPNKFKVTQPEGGGEPATAAAPQTAAEPPRITSIKNEQVDRERAVRGLPPAMEAGRRSFGTVWDDAMAEIEKNPERPQELIDELKKKPRALDDKEDAMLLHRQIDLQNQFEKTANDLIVANEGGDLGLVDELNVKAARLSDQLLDVYEAGKQAGTETGRGLNARKMLASEDFSLANMITQKRAAVKGRQLTPEQVAEVGKAHQDISARQIAYDAYETSPRAEAYRRRLRNLAAQYRERTAKGDFAPRPRKQILLDPEGMKLKADLEKAKIEFKRGLAKDRLSNRTWWEKALDGVAKWRRTFILTWPTVLGKLTTASGELIGITPAEELVRKGVTKVLPGKITEKSLRYGKGSSLNTEVGAIVHTWKELFKAVPQRFKTGNADIDLLYGRPDIVPSEFKDYVSNLHSALKEPARQNEFFRAQQQILQRYAERGVDISDPIIQTKAGFEAYRHANAQIFVENNRLANAINSFIGRLGDVDKLTGKPSVIGKAGQTAARYELPIVRIPLNIIKRTFEYSFGVPTGTVRLIRGMIQGLDGMPQLEADAIIRNLSRGALGMGAIAYGYFHPEQFGGYYQKGEKRSPDDVKIGHVKLGKVDLPPWAVHNPLLAQFQIGASIRRIVDSKLRKRDVTGPGYRQAIVATYGGVIEDAPLVRQTQDSLKALDIRQQNQFFGEHLKSAVPGAVEWAAQQLDKDENGNPVVRKPEDVLDYVKMGIPFLRQQVPEKGSSGRITPIRPVR